MFIPQFWRGKPSGNSANWQVVPGGMRSSSSNAGVIITPETALALSAVRACVTLLAESVAVLCSLMHGQKLRHVTS